MDANNWGGGANLLILAFPLFYQIHSKIEHIINMRNQNAYKITQEYIMQNYQDYKAIDFFEMTNYRLYRDVVDNKLEDQNLIIFLSNRSIAQKDMKKIYQKAKNNQDGFELIKEIDEMKVIKKQRSDK